MRWFGHVARMDKYHMARRVLMAEASGGRVGGRPRLILDGWCKGGLGKLLHNVLRWNVITITVLMFTCDEL